MTSSPASCKLSRMKTRTIVEDVTGSRSRRYYAEVEDTELNIRRESDSVAEAARRVVDAVRYKADDAERKFVEAGILPKKADEPKVGTTLPDVLRSGKWFYRRSRGTRIQYQMRDDKLWARDVVSSVEHACGKDVPFGVREILADDWELVP